MVIDTSALVAILQREPDGVASSKPSRPLTLA
jgi:uncharacterized protein with PIN domain